MPRNILLEEKQYLGLNHYSMLRGLVLALFCFVAYYFTEDREQNAELLFWWCCITCPFIVVYVYQTPSYTCVR